MFRRRTPTEAELAALVQKFDNPRSEVKCPRCGKPLVYIENPHGRASKCDTCSTMIAERGI